MQLNRFWARKATTRFTDTAPGPRVTPKKYVRSHAHWDAGQGTAGQGDTARETLRDRVWAHIE